MSVSQFIQEPNTAASGGQLRLCSARKLEPLVFVIRLFVAFQVFIGPQRFHAGAVEFIGFGLRAGCRIGLGYDGWG